MYLCMYNCMGLYNELNDIRRDFCVICCHLQKDVGDLHSSVYSCPYKNIFEERAVFLRYIHAGVRSTFLFIGYLRGFCGAYYSILADFVSLFLSRLLLV